MRRDSYGGALTSGGNLFDCVGIVELVRFGFFDKLGGGSIVRGGTLGVAHLF